MSGPEVTELEHLAQTLYSRNARPGDTSNGTDARIYRDARREIERLQEMFDPGVIPCPAGSACDRLGRELIGKTSTIRERSGGGNAQILALAWGEIVLLRHQRRQLYDLMGG